MAVAAADGVGGSRYFRLMLSGVGIGRGFYVVVTVAALTGPQQHTGVWLVK